MLLKVLINYLYMANCKWDMFQICLYFIDMCCYTLRNRKQ